jgi:ribosomal protein S6
MTSKYLDGEPPSGTLSHTALFSKTLAFVLFISIKTGFEWLLYRTLRFLVSRGIVHGHYKLSNIYHMVKKHEDKEVVELQKYELGYHFVPSLGEEDLALRVRELMEAITAVGGSIMSEGAPQPFTLAYTMKRQRGGVWEKYDTSYFGWVRFEAPREGMGELKDTLDHTEHLIRHLIMKLEKQALAPTPEPRQIQPEDIKEVVPTEPKVFEKKQDDEEDKGEVQEEELDKQIEDLIK